MITTARVTVGNSSATLLYSASSGKVKVWIENELAGASLFLGSSGMTSYADGCGVPSGVSFELHKGDDIYGILESGSGQVGVLAIS